MKTILASLTVAAVIFTNSGDPVDAREPGRVAASFPCDKFASLSQEDLLRALDEAVQAGATGWPGPDTVCMNGPQIEAQLPARRKPGRKRTAD